MILSWIYVKINFLKESLDEEFCVDQLKSFFIDENENVACKIVSLVLWYYFSFGFKENIFDLCTYSKISGSKFIFMILYIDNILLVNNVRDLLHELRNFTLRTLKWNILVRQPMWYKLKYF